jgi:hypothetical protein
MLIFILLSLGLCVVKQFSPNLQPVLWSEFFIYAGLIVALASVIGSFLKRCSDAVAYDAFSSATLLLWFAYWQPLFEPDAPIFFFYPLYFALMSAFITLFLSNQGHRIDKATLNYMRYLDKERILPAWTLMLGVLGSLELRQHYQLYPVLMTLLMLRFAFSSCIEQPTRTNQR